MDERAYTQQKEPIWSRLSDSLDKINARGVKALDRESLKCMGDDYRALVYDLAYARSQGASDKLIGYLNDLAGRAHGVLYVSGSAKSGGIRHFLLREFPRTFRASYKYCLAAMLLFAFCWGFATYSLLTNPDLGNQMIPQQFKKRDSNGEISIPNPADMSSFIMTNNIKVGILSYAGGITAGALTVFELAQNGVVLGAVATVAGPAMGKLRFWSLILPHGVIELVAIFICGGAGLTTGCSIVAPGNLRRADSIRIASARALKLFAGSLPMFVIAAIIEGFLTPSVIPPWSKLAFAGLTAIALAIYLGFGGETRQL